MSVWGELIGRLNLRPKLLRVGPGDGRVHFKGKHEGLWLSLMFDRGGRAELGLAHEEATSIVEDEAWRITARAQVPGYRPQLQTGDAEFDAEVLLLSKERYGPLALLGPLARRRIRRFVQRGGACAPGRVTVSREGMAAITEVDAALKLVAHAVEVVRLLDRPRRDDLLDRALTSELAAIRSAARGALGGRIRPEEILPRLPADNSPAVVEQLVALRPNNERAVRAWVARLASVPSAAALPALVEVLGQRVPLPTEAFQQLQARLAERWRAGQSPSEALRALATRSPRALTAACSAARASGSPQAGAWLAELEQPADVRRAAEVVDALRALGHPAADRWTLAMRPANHTEARIAARRLAGVPGPEASAALAKAALSWPELMVHADVQAEVVSRLAYALRDPSHPDWVTQLAQDLPFDHVERLLRDVAQAAPAVATPWLLQAQIPSPQVAQHLASVLGGLGDPRAEARLLLWLDHDVQFVQRAAIDALGECGTLAAVDPLERFTGFFSSGELKAAATAAIAAIRARGAVSPVGGLSDAGGAGGGLSEVD